MVAHERGQFLGSGAFGTERGEAPGRLDTALAGLEDLALDALGLATAVESGVAVPLGSGEVDHGTVAALDAPVSILETLERRRVAEADGLEFVEDGLLVLLDRSDDMVGAPPGPVMTSRNLFAIRRRPFPMMPWKRR